MVKRRKMTLANVLSNRIRATGAITFAEYMKQALTNPLYGYYMTKDVFGASGDFTTSPEISQIFGELLGVWCVDSWYRMGAPKPLQLVELGPGRGTLANDILRVFSKLEASSKQEISYGLVELSPRMAQMQMKLLCGSASEANWDPTADVCYRGVGDHGFRCSWYRQLQQVPNNFTIFIAHEFFDAMPVHKFKRKDGVWREILVDIDDQGESRFRFVLSKHPTPASILFNQECRPCDGLSEAEYSPDSGVLMDQLARRVVEDGGSVLIVDYGHQGEKGDTIRGFCKHEVVHPLLNPGQVDITADVNFRYLNQVANKHEVICFGPLAQGDFLRAMGIELRLERLLRNVGSSEERDQLTSACQVLLNADRMGQKFHFMSLFPSVIQRILQRHPPSGFTTTTTSLNS